MLGCRRHARLRYRDSNIFQDFGTSNCFAVRYFEQSKEHQQLLAAFETHATHEKAKKVNELQGKQQRYKELKLASETACQYVEVEKFGFRENVHSSSCTRQRYEREAESIEISILEWPLPTDPLRAKSNVFELRAPEPFRSWRDTTLFFLNLKYEVEEQPRAQYRPETYRGLSSSLNNHELNQRNCTQSVAFLVLVIERLTPLLEVEFDLLEQLELVL